MPKFSRREALKVLGALAGSLAASAFKAAPTDNTIFFPVIANNFVCPTMTITAAGEFCNHPVFCPSPYEANVQFFNREGFNVPTFVVYYDGVQVQHRVFGICWECNDNVQIVIRLDGLPEGLPLRIDAIFSGGCVVSDECIYPKIPTP